MTHQTCVLTGTSGEDADDCTTHDHEHLVTFRIVATYMGHCSWRSNRVEALAAVGAALGSELIEQDGVETVVVSYRVPDSNPEAWQVAVEWDKSLADEDEAEWAAERAAEEGPGRR